MLNICRHWCQLRDTLQLVTVCKQTVRTKIYPDAATLWALLILQLLRHFTYVTTHSPTLLPLIYVTAHSTTLLLLHLHHSSFFNPSFASPMSQAIHLIHLASRPCSWFNEQSSFSNLSITSPISQLILQLFCRFTYVKAHYPTLPSLYLCHSSFTNPSIALPTSKLIIQPFRRFTYVTVHSSTLLLLLLHHKLFT